MAFLVFIKQPAQPHIFSEDNEYFLHCFDRSCGSPYKWHIGAEYLRYEATSQLRKVQLKTSEKEQKKLLFCTF